MFTDFCKLNIKGGYFDEGSSLKFFDKQQERICIVYGRNGSGKSSIGRAINQYKTNNGTFEKVELLGYDERKIELIDNDKNSIYVFNEDYIEQNIRINEDGLKTIVMFGKQVDLDNDININQEELKKLNNIFNDKNEELKKLNNKKELSSPLYLFEKMTNILKEDNRWASIDSQIKGNKYKTSVNKSVVDRIGNLKVNEKLNVLKNKFEEKYSMYCKVNKDSKKFEHEIKGVLLSEDVDRKILDVLTKKVDRPKLEERESEIIKIIDNKGQQRIEEMLDTFENSTNDICPYCFQKIDDSYREELIKSIHTILNKEVEEYKNEIKNVVLNEIEIELGMYIELDKELVNLIKVNISECNKVISQYNNYLKNKFDNVYNSIEFENLNLFEKVEVLNNNIKRLEEKREQYNENVDNRDRIKNELLDLNSYIAWYDIKEYYREYQESKNKKEEVTKLLGKIKIDADNTKKKITRLKEDKRNIRIALDNINHSLEYIFFSQNRLKLEVRNDRYCLKSRGKDVELHNISVGERNMLALCYFFSQILDNCNEGEEFSNKCLVVLDDPISSFDIENKIGMHSYIRNQISKIINGNLDSRVIILTHELEAALDFNKSSREIAKGKISINLLEQKRLQLFNVEGSNEYTNLIELAFNYANKNEGYENLNLTIGNTLRRILEAYSTFEYRTGMAEISCDKDILNKIDDKNLTNYFENSMYRLVLNGESHSAERVKSMSDTSFYNFISQDEKIRTARDVLVFLYLLNPQHIKAHLKGINGAFKKVEGWLGDLKHEVI